MDPQGHDGLWIKP